MTRPAVSAVSLRAARAVRPRPGLRVVPAEDPARAPGRVARARATRGTRPVVFSDAELLRGVRRVSSELGRPPSLSEYERLRRQLGLPCGQTVCVRFGGWRRALETAGLKSTPARVYPRGWHIAACWRALESVAEQLGDPPGYRRYAALAAGREDLPSATTVSVRLGPWQGIAAALGYRPVAARTGRTALGEPTRAPERHTGEGRVVSARAARTLAHLRAHPGASGMAVKHATGIAHYSQAWKLLARLERDGMVEGRRIGRARAWTLTAQGTAVLQGLPEDSYA